MTAAGSLLENISRVEARAHAMGALVELVSTRVAVEDPKMPFVACWISSMEMKNQAAMAPPPSGNPFLPYDEELFVDNLDGGRVLIVNKFQMEQGHVLIISRVEEPQQAIVSSADIAAVSRLLSEIDGMMMYNGGRMAGASQDHRHLHILQKLRLPLDQAFTDALPAPGLGKYAPFDFDHVLVRFKEGEYADAAAVYEKLRQALRQCGLDPDAQGKCPPYNLLMTRRWLLVAPRSHQYFDPDGAAIAVNALHFGGLCFVRTPDQQDAARKAGLAAILQACTGKFQA